jgi:hypothetical protein
MIVQIEKALITGIYNGKKNIDYVTMQINEGAGELKLAIPKDLMGEIEWGNMYVIEARVSPRLFNNNLNLMVKEAKVKPA